MRYVFVILFTMAVPAFAEDWPDKPCPKPLKEGEKVKTDGWFGKKVLPKRHSSEIRMGDWVDGKMVTWTPYNLMSCVVREEREGFLRVYDNKREGWVNKDDMVKAEDASNYFDKAVKERPKDPDAWQMRGFGWFEKRDYESAMKDFNEAIRLDAKNVNALNCRGLTWAAMEQYGKAIADHTEAIRIEPRLATSFNNCGLARHHKREYDKAITNYNAALRRDSKFPDALCNRGFTWIATKEYDNATVDFTEALSLNPKYIDALQGRGISWHYMKEYEKANADYTAVLRIDPENLQALVNRANYWRQKKENDKSHADLDVAFKIKSKEAYVHGNRAITYAKLKKYDDAATGFEKAIELNPFDWIHRDYARFRASCPDAKYRDGKKAVELAKKGIEKVGKDLDWNYPDALAMAYAEVGDFELAVTEQRKAVEMLKAEKYVDKGELKEAEARLELYRAKKPYRDDK